MGDNEIAARQMPGITKSYLLIVQVRTRTMGLHRTSEDATGEVTDRMRMPSSCYFVRHFFGFTKTRWAFILRAFCMRPVVLLRGQEKRTYAKNENQSQVLCQRRIKGPPDHGCRSPRRGVSNHD